MTGRLKMTDRKKMKRRAKMYARRIGKYAEKGDETRAVLAVQSLGVVCARLAAVSAVWGAPEWFDHFTRGMGVS